MCQVDRSPTNVTVKAPEATGGELLSTPQGVLFKGPLNSDSGKNATLRAGFVVVDDVAPSNWYSVCWSSNRFGTCDLMSAESSIGTLDMDKPLPIANYSTFDLSSATKREALDGLDVCAYVFVRSALYLLNTGVSSTCVTLDFSAPTPGIAVDGTFVFVDDKYFATPTTAFMSWGCKCAFGLQRVWV